MRQLFIAIAFLSLLITSCNTSDTPPTDLGQAVIIPKPQSSAATGGRFTLTSETSISVADEKLALLGDYLAEKLQPATGFTLPVSIHNSPEK